MTAREIQVNRWTHVWIGDMPDKYLFNTDKVLEHRLTLTNSERMTGTPPYVGIRHTKVGGPGRFGVLGASFVPDTSDALVIQVLMSEQIPKWESGFAGLSQYAQTVLEEAVKIVERTGFLGSGTLRFDKGAEHPVDSAPAVFYRLVRSIITLMALNLDAMSDRDIAVIVRSLFVL